MTEKVAGALGLGRATLSNAAFNRALPRPARTARHHSRRERPPARPTRLRCHGRRERSREDGDKRNARLPNASARLMASWRLVSVAPTAPMRAVLVDSRCLGCEQQATTTMEDAWVVRSLPLALR